MKRILVVLTALAVSLTCFACTNVGGKEVLSGYEITASYEDGTVTGHLNYTLVNGTENSVASQEFLLYGKAYSEDAVHPASTDPKAYYKGKNYGDMTVENVTVSGVAATPEYKGDDGEIVRVSFNELFPGECVTIGMDFTVKLAEINHRLGITPQAINLCNWYPTASARENGEFLSYAYDTKGDPFCTDAADYEVKLTVPEGYVVAASAPATVTENAYVYSARKMRDFAFVLGKNFKTAEADVGNVKVTYYYYNDATPDASLKAACDAMTYFSEYGDYPYLSYAVVETGFHQGGMEYPGLVLISDATGDFYNECIVHETAHQWWYGIVGNDEVRHAWQDEGLTDFMTTLFYDAHPEYGATRVDRIMKTLASYLTYVDVYSSLNGTVNTVMDRPLSEFRSEQEYTYMTYVKGELMFDTLRTDIGEEKFDKALKDYCKKYAFKRASPEDMIACFNAASGRNLESFFRSWLDGKVVLA